MSKTIEQTVEFTSIEGTTVRVGFELSHLYEPPQLIHSTNRQKRENRYFRRFGVHGGYTEAWRA